MTNASRASLEALLRRVDEVRGLSERAEAPPARHGEDSAALLQTLAELVEELEHSHRRLIETQVQLVSLREVASCLVTSLDTGEATRTVTRYLHRAFGFDEVFLLLVDREAACLDGTWTHGLGERDRSYALELPLLGDAGTLTHCLWLNRTLVRAEADVHPAAALPADHALREVLGALGPAVCVPLQRSQSVLPAGQSHELCGARCPIGDPAVIAPPPGTAVAHWAEEREARQRHCLSCELMPILGVIGMARPAGGPSIAAADVSLLESIALSVAPVVESARLYHELRRSERFREHVLDSMAGGLVAVNLHGEVLTFNHAAEELLGHRQAAVLGRRFGELFGEEGEELLRATLERGSESLRREIRLRAADGSLLPVRITTSLLRNEKRNIYGAIATFVDLTPIRRAEEHARSLDRLAALGRFTSSVAHEIRNPLTGIGTGIQYLSRALAPDDPQRQNLNFILREIKRLDAIVQDLFDITHPRRLQLEATPLVETLARALRTLEPLLEERGVTVRIEQDPATPPAPHDSDQMQQVLINLIKNAAEASEPGGTLLVALEPCRAPAGGARGGEPGGVTGVVARVQDRGCGIAPEHLKTLFEPFFTTKPGGTGLGLYISHDIVKRHGGSLTVQSEPGCGTTFTVELPLENHGGNP